MASVFLENKIKERKEQRALSNSGKLETKNQKGTKSIFLQNKIAEREAALKEAAQRQVDYERSKEERTEREENKSSVSGWEIAGNSIMSGLGTFNKGLMSTLDFVLPTEFLGKYDFISNLNEYYSNQDNYYKQKKAESLEGKSTATKILADVGEGTVSAIPNAVLALMSGGTSAAGAALGNAAPASTGIVSTLGNTARTVVKNPLYWSSMAQTLGTDYEEAKANGANEFVASASAIIKSGINAGIEIGGGIEKLPENLKNGNLTLVKDWVMSMLEEGREEVVQGIVSASVDKLMYDYDKKAVSLSDENAIISPQRMIKEFGMGATVGGVLGGMQTGTILGANKAVQAYGKRQLKKYDEKSNNSIKIVGEYKKAVNDKLVHFIQEARNNTTDNKSVFKLKNVNNRMAEDIEELTGIDVKNYGNVIKANSIRHIIKDHGVNGETDSSMADDADIARMQYVIDNYDTIELLEDKSKEFRDKKQQPAPMVKLSKRVNGTYYVVEAVPDTNRHEIAVVTAYKQKATEQQTRDVKNPHSDVQNASADVAFNNTIPQGGNGVNKYLQSTARSDGFGENGRKAFEASVKKGQDEALYTMGFQRMYNLGQINMPLEKAKNEIEGNKYIQELSSDQRMAAYYAGQNDAKAQLEAEKNAVKLVKYYTDDAGVVDNEAAKKVDEADLREIDRIAKITGSQVVLVDDIEGANGYVELGKIHISLNAQHKALLVMAHEVTHRMQELAPESYRKYRDFVIDTVGVEMIESYRTELNKKDVYLTESGIMDEIAADYTRNILSDTNKMQQFIDDALNGKLDKNTSVSESRNVLQKLYDAIRDFLKKIGEKFGKNKTMQNKAAEDTFGTDVDTLKQAEALLGKALKDSAKTVSELKKQGEKAATSASTVDSSLEEGAKGQKRYSIKKDFYEKYDEWVKTDRKSNITLTVGRTSKALRSIEVKEQKITWDTGKIRKTLNDHPYLDDTFIKRVPEILEHPVIILQSKGKESRIVLFGEVNDVDGLPIAAVLELSPTNQSKTLVLDEIKVVSTHSRKSKNNPTSMNQTQNLIDSSDILYIDPNKNRTNNWLSLNGLQLPVGETDYGPIKSVTYPKEYVNTYSMQKSKNNSQRKNSIKMDDILRQNETLKKVVVKLNSDIQKMKGQKGNYNPKRIATVSKDIIDEFDFAYDRAKLSEKLDGLSEAAKQMIDGKMDIDTLKAKFVDVAKDVIETGTINDSAEYAESKALRDTLRTTAISLNEDARRNLGDEYETIRKSTFGRLRLVKEGGVPIDIQYRELAELYPEFFDAETEIHQSDQLKRIAEVLDGLQSLKSNPYDGYIDEASEWLSNIMMDRIFNEIFIAGETGKVKITVDMRNMRNEMADNLQRIMARDREWREREYSKLHNRYEKRVKNYTEARQKAIKIKQIKLHTERLSKALLNPSERFAVPEDLKKPVAELLSCIDLRNDRIGEKTRETLGDLMSTYNTIAEQEYELGMVLDPQLVHNLDSISEAVKGLGVKEKRVSDLDLITLEQLRNSIMAMETMLRNYNQTFRDGKRQQIDALAASACSEIKERVKAIKKTSKVKLVKGFSDMLNFDMLNPWDYFHQMGGTFESLFVGLRDGENRQIKNLARGKEYLEEMTKKYGISQKDMKDKSVKTFTFANGETVELTKSQVMSLYLLWRQEQTHEHITEGGIRPATVTQSLIENKDGTAKVKMTVSEDYSAARANLDDIAAILSTLSEAEKKFAESISDFFVKECAEWGNEVALKLYGYKKFNTPNYFPIVSDKMYLQEDFGVSADSTIKNMGITKKRIKHANNPIIIEDIFEVYARHVSDMAKYNAYVLPLQDIQRVFNSRGLDGENNVKALIATKFGKQAVTYFSKLMVDINMGINNQYGNALSSNLISKYKQAKMGLNARVVIQQPISYIRAAALIDPKYMTQAMGKKVDIEKVFKYSPIARWKSWGFFSTDTGKDMYSLMTNEKEMSDYTMWMAGKADEMTWKRIWAAIELETADRLPDLQKGSEVFYEACGKRFDEIVDRTQVVDSTLHRSQALRSPDGLTKMAYSFMSEPLKTYNLLRTAAVDAFTAKDSQSKKQLARTVGVCVLSSVVLAAVTGAFDTLTGDEEEEFLKNWRNNLLGDAVGMIPYIKDVSSIIQGFTVERMDMQGIGDVANAILTLGKDGYTWKYKIANLSAKGAELGGVPVGSIKKFVYDLIAKNIFKGADNHLFFYNVAKLMYIVDGKKKSEFMDILFDAYKAGNKKQYDKIIRDMIKSGIKADDIESALKKKFKDSGIKETFPVPWNKSFDISADEDTKKFGLKDLSGTQYQSYEKKVTTMEKDITSDLKRMRGGLTEDEYQKRLKSAHEYVIETAMEQVANGKYESDKPWVNKVQKAEKLYGLDPAEVIMVYRYKNDLKPPKGKEKFENNEKKNLVVDYLNGMELTRDEWLYLYYEICGYKK